MSGVTDQLPAEVCAALDDELGEPERVFGSSAPALMRGVRSGLTVAGVFVLIALVVLVLAPAWAVIFPLVVAAWAAVSVLPKWFKAAQSRTELIVLCAHGFVQRDEQDEVIIFRFDKIVSVRQDVRDIYGSGVKLRTEHRFTVTTSRRNTCVLDDRFADIGVLGEQVSRRVAERLLPAAVRKIEQGRTAVVRPFRLDRSGIAVHDRQLAWPRVTGAGFVTGRFQVTEIGRRKPWVSVAASDIDNIFLLSALVNALRG